MLIRFDVVCEGRDVQTKKAPTVEARKRLIFNVENIGIEPMTS